MAKKIDPKAKAKRQKIYAAVGGLLLLGLLAFQVPRTMKMLHQQGADAAASTSATTPTSAPASSTGATAASAASGGSALGDPDALPSPQSGQLLAFGRFRSKDPFAQQVQDCSGDSGACPSAPASSLSSSAGAKAPAKKAPGSATAAVSSGAAPSTGTSSAQSPVTAATISVNGVAESVHVGAKFPASNPTFTLVSLTKSSAKIGIAGGSLENGAATVTLKKGSPLTLMNTADGTRYVLRLLAVS